MKNNVLNEDNDLGPQDHEASMARAELYKSAEYAIKIFHMIQPGDNLEGWVAAKITKAADYLDSVAHYMEYQKKFEEPKMDDKMSLDSEPEESLTAEVAENLADQWKKFKTQG